MIYIKDSNQDQLDNDSDVTVIIKGDPKVIAAELTWVLYQCHTTNPHIVNAAIKAFWEEVKNDSHTE